MKRFLIFSLAVLLVPLADWFLQKHIIMDGQIYDRDATVLVLPGGLPEEVDRLGDFSNLFWLDLRGTGITGEEYEEVRRAAGREI